MTTVISQVTLLRETVITGISTQGYGGEDDVENWVRRYYIQTQASGKKSGRDFKTVTDENGVVKVWCMLVLVLVLTLASLS